MYNDDTQIYLFCTLQLVVKTQLNEPSNKYSSEKVLKVVKPINKKTLGTSVIKNPPHFSLPSWFPCQGICK